MVGLRRNRFLSCFCCGRKTSIVYDGKIRQFDCPKCDATNWLDENGEVTDPPTSATNADGTPSKTRYTVQRAAISPTSDTSHPSDSVWCNTCLNNQRLFQASIAQYLPDDPDAPDYEVREKDYRDYRRRLERRYPQICAECEPKVQKRLEQAAYTAKTDVLRRMIDRSQKSKAVVGWSWLDVFDTIGRWLWRMGYALEILSHVAGLSMLGRAYCGQDNGNLVHCRLLDICWPIVGWIPAARRLLFWSALITCASVWWNPRFPQVIRGFTKHLIGLRNWYTYQVMLIAFRFLAPTQLQAIDSRTSDPQFLAGAIFGMLLLSTLVFFKSRTAVRTDTTPLFRSQTSPLRISAHERRTSQDDIGQTDGKHTMADILEEIMHTPTAAQQLQAEGNRSTDSQRHASGTRGWGGNFSNNLTHRSPQLPPPTFGTQHTPDPNPEPESDAMDWSPTHSKHRAFTSFRTAPGFSQAPTEDHKGPFWYKNLPPAPSSLAQRAVNPPNQPRFTNKKPLSVDGRNNSISFRGPAANGTNNNISHQENQPPEPVLFKDPHFFPPQRDDPRDPLTDMFAESFTLGRKEEEGKNESGSWLGRWMGRRKERND